MFESPHPLAQGLKSLGLTPAKAAAKLGISLPHLSNLLNRRRRPSLELFEKMRTKVKTLKPSDFKDSRQ